MMPALSPALDLDLIRKYAVPGPRYTSYPPATQFTTELAPLSLQDAIQEDNAPGAGPLSLYFHLPFCESRCWFCGCNTVITRRRESADDYLGWLIREVRLTARLMDPQRQVAQIHFGGGTPTFFPPDELRRLGALIHEHFLVAPDCEFSVEVDPRRLTRDHVHALQEIGANRASLGIQDTNPAVQLAVHRIQPQAQNQQAFTWLREAGFSSINVDLIYGLPLQTADSFARTIDDVLTLDPDRLSVFGYAHVPWIKPAQKIFDQKHTLPSAENRLAMFAVAREKLTEAGYLDVGLDHFAKPGDELAGAALSGGLHRNFQGYSTRAGASLYAFGISSISQTADTFRQNFKTLPEWQAALAAGHLPVEKGYRLSIEDQRRRTIIMSIMCARRLDFAALSAELGVDFECTYAAELGTLGDLITDGVLQRDATGLSVTEPGLPLLRVIAMKFDAYLRRDAQRHSKTI
ncbi:MAG: oxygen-independent coproporphyrinogen III oxidase [Opitutaceae bacterium]|nr:oxygen-independent coproporphyrinogen III oxidase [Cephaloticoccus sp.]MCP5529705.1 oxygen-independent coproporphyrinogen III oxidase [Opitutaceae bacterium]